MGLKYRDKQGHRALREINRVMKEGTQLFICHTSSREQINRIYRGISEVEDDLIPEESEMRALLLATGFRDIRIEDNDHTYLAAARKTYDRRD
ncbi:hypothetical protein ACFLWN_02690 [Chloroflexota bacterium]